MLALEKQKRTLDFQPGYGPTRWLWPVAAQHPRAWVPGGDILLEPFTSVSDAAGYRALGLPSPSRGSPSSPESPM